MGVADDFLNSFFKHHPEAMSGNLNMKELSNLMTAYQNKINSDPQEDFDGLNAEQMHHLLYAPFSDSCILQFNRSAPEHLHKIPLFKLSEILLGAINDAGNMKLTSKGNLPVRVCELLVGQKLIEWEYMKYVKKITEDTIPYIWPLKQFLLAEGIVKKRKNILSLTKAGKIFFEGSEEQRFIKLLLFFTNRLHWGNFYHIDDDGQAGQLGWAYSLVLLSKYGDKIKTAEFYSLKVMRAFEQGLRHYFQADDPIGVRSFPCAYTVRFFECFAEWFGLVKIERKKVFEVPFERRVSVTKSALFDELFTVEL